MSTPEETARAQAVERYLKEEKQKWKKLQREPRVLILGSSDSGKSTLLKQLKILHGDGFTPSERIQATNRIRGAIFGALATLLAILEGPASKELQEKYSDIFEYANCWDVQQTEVDADIIPAICEAVREQAILDIFKEGQHTLPDTTEFFLENVSRILCNDYIPTNEDILSLRMVTQSVSETIFTIKGVPYHFYDVSGLTYHRKVWTGYFSNVDTVLFVASLSAYNQMLVEDPTVNRMADAMVLFQQIGNHPLLVKVPFILFMNKRDIYEKKAKKIPIINYFPEYSGKKFSISQGASFFRDKLYAQCPQTHIIAAHVTCATDTKAMEVIIDGVL
ncbi:hypothetical protein HDV03_000589 [Kappamyces sp. JEL0829]|nr:hypothetical protein HDV03_000589 [Kappamyces sp. JEL0829]